VDNLAETLNARRWFRLLLGSVRLPGMQRFAHLARAMGQCQSMQKTITALMIQFLAMGGILLGCVLAQDTPTANTAQPAKPASTQSTTGTAQSPAAKKPAGNATKTAIPYTLKTQKDKESYALGMSIGSGFRKQNVTKSIDTAALIRGLRDAMAGGKTLLTEDEMKAALQQLRTEVTQQAAAENVKAGAAFLAANKTKEGVVVLPDGLQYKILTAGSGPKPSKTDTVTVKYRGTLVSGKEFDSSDRHGGTATFEVGRVIPGWTEALQLMPVGSKWQLFIPAELAYADNPPPPSGIGPGETLIFEVELISIGEQKK